MSATARAATARPTTARRGPTPARAGARRRPVLTEVPAAPSAVAGNGVFALIVIGLLVGGMGVLLVLNTTLAAGAFELGRLTSTQNQLAVSEQQLLQQVALEESPVSLQTRANALGMVPVAAPVFLRLADGAVLGDTAPAGAESRAQRASNLPSSGGVPAATSAGTTAARNATARSTVTTARARSGSDAAVADAGTGTSTGTDAALPDPTTGGTGR